VTAAVSAAYPDRTGSVLYLWLSNLNRGYRRQLGVDTEPPGARSLPRCDRLHEAVDTRPGDICKRQCTCGGLLQHAAISIPDAGDKSYCVIRMRQRLSCSTS
jgi:hypothetical protein